MFRKTLARLIRNKAATVGMVIVIIVALTAVFASWLAPYNPSKMNFKERLVPPSWKHPLGTDYAGRDMLSRIIYGARVSMTVGFFAVCVSILVGVTIGTLAGYIGGLTDVILMRLLDIFMAFPSFLLAIIFVVAIGNSQFSLIIAVGLAAFPYFARLTRGSVLSVKEKEYVEAARALGYRPSTIALFHVLPNCLPPIIVMATLLIASAIIMEASLSLLGIGTQPPTPSWGYDLQANLIRLGTHPWLSIFPGLTIMISVFAFNLFGDGLRDALDPRLKL